MLGKMLEKTCPQVFQKTFTGNEAYVVIATEEQRTLCRLIATKNRFSSYETKQQRIIIDKTGSN